MGYRPNEKGLLPVDALDANNCPFVPDICLVGPPFGTLRVQCEARDGSWGIAQRGLGGYMTDVEGKLYEDCLQVKRFHPNGAMPGQEVAWRPCRRAV
eukprot:symbB.v1.2.034673.t1/scaffold4343.1/size40911/1